MTDSKNFMMLFRFEPVADYQPSQEELNIQKQQ